VRGTSGSGCGAWAPGGSAAAGAAWRGGGNGSGDTESRGDVTAGSFEARTASASDPLGPFSRRPSVAPAAGSVGPGPAGRDRTGSVLAGERSARRRRKPTTATAPSTATTTRAVSSAIGTTRLERAGCVPVSRPDECEPPGGEATAGGPGRGVGLGSSGYVFHSSSPDGVGAGDCAIAPCGGGSARHARTRSPPSRMVSVRAQPGAHTTVRSCQRGTEPEGRLKVVRVMAVERSG
jgi:hypothetical protein